MPELREMLLTQFTTQLMALRRWEEIVQVLNSPLARAGGLSASLHFALGLAHLERKQFSEAADQMRQCLTKRGQPSLAPINVEIHRAGPRHCLAMALLQLGDVAGAAEQFPLALADDPQALPVHLDYARFLATHGQGVEALNRLFALVQQRPHELPAWLLGGQIALGNPQFLEVAVDWTANACRHLPGELAVLLQRAEALTLAGRWPAAVAAWNAAHVPAGHAFWAQAHAGLILCETAAGTNRFQPEPRDQGLLSQEFLKWYQRLLQFGARSTIDRLNERLEVLAGLVPAAAQRLSSCQSCSRTRTWRGHRGHRPEP